MKGKVSCVTFGAPLFGDEELGKYLENEKSALNNIASRMYNFVCSEDPIPKLLSYTQSLSSFSSSLDQQISLLVNTFGTTHEGTSYHRYISKIIYNATIKVDDTELLSKTRTLTET